MFESRATYAVFALALLFATPTTQAEQTRINTWVDAQGIRHFSHTPPAYPVEQLQIRELAPLPPVRSDSERIQAMREVAAELELARHARAAARAADRIQIEANATAPVEPETRIIYLPPSYHAPIGAYPPYLPPRHAAPSESWPRPPHPAKPRAPARQAPSPLTYSTGEQGT